MKRRHAFTLVELLTVIAIISILIALLLPALKGARRRALVLVCPIAYLGKDNSIHLTDPQGAYDLSFENAGRAVTVAWSPSGRTLGITTRVALPTICSALLDPMSGNLVARAPADGQYGNFLFWANEQQYYELGNNGVIYPRDVVSGAVLPPYKPPSGIVMEWGTRPLPPQCAPLAFVCLAWRPDHSGYDIALLRKDLSIGRRISVPNGGAGSVCIDPLGECVAWIDCNSSAFRIALKRLRDPPWVQPIFSDKQYAHATICDWSEDGNWILANVTENRSDWSLALFDKNGKLVRKIPTAVPPQQLSAASWRKYGHR